MKRLLIPSGITMLLALVLLLGCAAAGATPTPTPAATAPYLEEPRPPGTYDDRQRRVGEAVPGFGGMFYDPPGSYVLNVYLLDNEDLSQVTPLRAALTREFPDIAAEMVKLRLVKGDYTVTQLLDWYDDLRLALTRAGLIENGGLAMTDMDDGLNRLHIRVTHERFRQDVLDAATTAGVPHEAVNITIGARDQLLKSVRDKFRPPVGGIKIQDADGTCTLGSSAIRSSVKGFVTASHCTPTYGGAADGTRFYQSTRSGSNRVRHETVDGRWRSCPSDGPWGCQKCRKADAASIKYDSGMAHDMGHIARTTGNGSRTIDNDNPRFRVYGERNSVRRGHVLMFIG